MCLGWADDCGVYSLHHVWTDVVYGCDLCDLVEDVCVHFLIRMNERRVS